MWLCVCLVVTISSYLCSAGDTCIPWNAATVFFNILNIRNDSAEARSCHVVSIGEIYDLVVPRSDVLPTRLNNTDRNYDIFSRNYWMFIWKQRDSIRGRPFDSEGGGALLVLTDYLFSTRARPENLFPGKPRTEYLFSTATHFLKSIKKRRRSKKEKKKGGGGLV